MFLVQDIVTDDRIRVYVHDPRGRVLFTESVEKYADPHGVVYFKCQFEAVLHAIWRLKRHVNA